MMKYYIADIETQNGEFEDITTIRFQAKNGEDADKLHHYHVGTWYGEDHVVWDDLQNSYMNDFIAISHGDITEIDKHTFDMLATHRTLPDLTRKMKDVEDWLERDAEYKAELAEIAEMENN